MRTRKHLLLLLWSKGPWRGVLHPDPLRCPEAASQAHSEPALETVSTHSHIPDLIMSMLATHKERKWTTKGKLHLLQLLSAPCGARSHWFNVSRMCPEQGHHRYPCVVQALGCPFSHLAELCGDKRCEGPGSTALEEGRQEP